MTTAQKLAARYPGKKWSVFYEEDGSERIEWDEPEEAPSDEEIAQIVIPKEPSLAERVAALEAEVFKK